MLGLNIFTLCLLLISFSSLYLVNLTAFSPVYISFLLSLPLSGYLMAKKVITPEPVRPPLIKVTFLSFAAIAVWLPVCSYLSHSNDFLHYAVYFYPMLYFPLGYSFLYFLEPKRFRDILHWYYAASSLLLLLDFLFRLLHALYVKPYSPGFYDFKFDGIMFHDSNFSGFLAMVNFCFALYADSEKRFSFGMKKLIFLFFLVLVNLSRAAIIASLFCVFLVWFAHRSRRIKILTIILLSLPLLYLIPLTISLFLHDGSFETKVIIFDRTIAYLKTASCPQLLFGTGINTSDLYLKGIAAHNYFSKTIIELGFVELFLELFMYLLLAVLSRGRFLFLFFPLMLAGLSMFSTATPYLYALTALMVHWEQNRGEICHE